MAKVQNDPTTPVIIVGAGPVGLALAGDLGWRNINTILVERGTGEVFQPKMDMVGIRTMEYCRRWGILDDVYSAGYNRAYPQDCAWVSSLHGGYEFGREEFPSVQDEAIPPESPQKRERCPQNFFDPVLTKFAKASGKSEILYQHEYVEHSESADGVTVTIRDMQSGETKQIQAQYLVGCDGGASQIRHALGIEMHGEPALTYTTNAIIECKGLEQLHDKKPGYRYIFIGPEGTYATIVAINGRDWWRLSIVGDENMRTLDEAEVAEYFVRAVGRDDFEFKVLSIMPWIRRQLVADTYGTDRVFLAGDAAHLTSPTGGFGMNTGIQDVVNLSWKLAATIEGWGGPALLQSYGMEQRPVAIRNVNEATSNLKNMLTPRKYLNKLVFEDGPEGEAARKEFGDAYTAMMKREWYSNGIHLGYRYEGSPVIVPDGTPEPEDTVSTYTQTSRPGHRAPHAWIEPGKSTLDFFGKNFVLMRFDRSVDADDLISSLEENGMPHELVDIDNSEIAALYEKKLVLVRPDGQVAWRGDTAPSDAAAVIDTVRGSALIESSAAEEHSRVNAAG